MTDNFFALHWCLCVSVSFILLLFHKQTPRNYIVGWKTKNGLFPAPSEHFPPKFFLKMSCRTGKRRKWHFRDRKFKNLFGASAFKLFFQCVHSVALQNLTLRHSVGKTEAMYEKLCINVKLTDVQLLRLHYLYFIYGRKIYVVHRLKLSYSWNPPKGKMLG